MALVVRLHCFMSFAVLHLGILDIHVVLFSADKIFSVTVSLLAASELSMLLPRFYIAPSFAP